MNQTQSNLLNRFAHLNQGPNRIVSFEQFFNFSNSIYSDLAPWVRINYTVKWNEKDYWVYRHQHRHLVFPVYQVSKKVNTKF